MRLLDPPLHEFLPNSSVEIKSLAEKMKVSPGALGKKIENMKESQPHAWASGLSAWNNFPGYLSDASQGHCRSGLQAGQKGH